MKILFIAQWYPNRIQPTNGNFIQRQAEAVGKYVEVVALNVCADKNLKNKGSERIDTIQNGVNNINVYYAPPKYFIKGLNFLYKFYVQWHWHQKIVNEVKPDIIHANITYISGFLAYLLKKKFKLPYIISEHWSQYLTVTSKPNFFQIFLSKLACKHASFICPVTENLANGMRCLGIKANYKIIPNVVNTQIFHFKEKTKSSVIRFIHVSTLKPEKNFGAILNVFYRLKKAGYNSFSLTVISDGETFPYEERSFKLGLQEYIKFYGMVSINEVAKYMQGKDYFILFSNYESLPCVLLEAAACGMKVISSNVGGISEFFNESNSILVPVNDDERLYNELQNILINNTAYSSESIAQFAKESFSYEVVGAKFLEIYQKVLR